MKPGQVVLRDYCRKAGISLVTEDALIKRGWLPKPDGNGLVSAAALAAAFRRRPLMRETGMAVDELEAARMRLPWGGESGADMGGREYKKLDNLLTHA